MNQNAQAIIDHLPSEIVPARLLGSDDFDPDGWPLIYSAGGGQLHAGQWVRNSARTSFKVGPLDDPALKQYWRRLTDGQSGQPAFRFDRQGRPVMVGHMAGGVGGPSYAHYLSGMLDVIGELGGRAPRVVDWRGL